MTKNDLIASLDHSRPVLIAGPTGSGKSSLAMDVACALDGPVVNADALQVYEDWRVLTARPSAEDEAAMPHNLYGYIQGHQAFSVGDWLRDLKPLLAGPPPIIVGGTGLYFSALTEGLADIPDTPSAIREEAMRRLETDGNEALFRELDDETANRIDGENPMRVQRAWEVLQSTGRGLASWQDVTPLPLLPLSQAQPIVLDAPKEWLTPRISKRFDLMVENGALEEARKNEPDWRVDLPSAKAIGAAELIAHVRGEIGLEEAKEIAKITTRQYAKRQRSWFRSRMKDWQWVAAVDLK